MPSHGKLEPLVTAHPLLFKGRFPRTHSHLPSGWYDLADRLCSAIEQLLNPGALVAFEVLQVKEKLGSLRFHFLPGALDDSMQESVRALARQARIASGITCQACGQPAVTRNFGGHVASLCETHTAHMQVKQGAIIHSQSWRGPMCDSAECWPLPSWCTPLAVNLRVFLADEHTTPQGWVRAYWPGEAIQLLESGCVIDLSLEHALGNDHFGASYDVVLWIQHAIVTWGFQPPRITVHSVNVSAREKLLAGVDAIERLAGRL